MRARIKTSSFLGGHDMGRDRYAFPTVVMLTLLAACTPKIGSERWCEQMKDKDKGEWTANDATAFAKHCVLGLKASD